MKFPNEQFWKVFKNTEGALSTAEAMAIVNIAVQVPDGTWIELGTHKGKSGMSAVLNSHSYVEETSLKPYANFYIVDPIFEDKELAKEVSEKIYKTAKGKFLVIPIADYSYNVIEKHAPYSYVFLDSGSHGDGLPMQEVRLLEDRVVSGGIIALHDFKNQFTQVEQAFNYLISTGKYEPIHIDWQPIFDYVKEHNLEEGNNSWHLYPELPHPPNFIGALKRK